MSDHLSVPELAAQIGANPKRVREWMRAQGWRHPAEAGQPWALTGEQAAILTTLFSTNPAGAITMEASITPDTNEIDDVAGEEETPLAQLTVGELIDTYTGVLAELRTRHLVRTSNAPTGDLAEFCAAMVYDGLLAPNSEKSYDLVAADDRKIQVKVRLVRPGMASGAVFSPIRSFDFDLCTFLVIDNNAGQVVAAREWTPAEVREHGSFKQHTNGTVVTVSQLRSTKARGVDRTADFNTAWQELLSQAR